MKYKLLLRGSLAAFMFLLAGCGTPIPTLTQPYGEWMELNPPIVLEQDPLGDLHYVEEK